MKLIIKDRGMGKTTQLIYMSEATGYPIVTNNKFSINSLKMRAKKLGCEIPEPITSYEMASGKKRGNHLYDNILVDEVALDGVLKDALNKYFNSNVVTCTCSPYYTNDELMDMYDKEFCDWPKRNLIVISD